VAVSCCGCAGDDAGGDSLVGGSVEILKGINGAGGPVGDIVRVVVGMLEHASKLGCSNYRCDRLFTCTVICSVPHVITLLGSDKKTRARQNRALEICGECLLLYRNMTALVVRVQRLDTVISAVTCVFCQNP